MKSRIALAALAAALALSSPAFAAGAGQTPAPASRSAQIVHQSSAQQISATQDLYRRAQRKLADLHMYTGAVDGSRNTAFVQSLEHFQRAHNIRATGRINSQTRAALGI
jgi:peptidoglycan hydrolase-like protein with peptidoglycan-binding domain